MARSQKEDDNRVLYYNHDTPPEMLQGLLALAAENGLELKRRRPPREDDKEEPSPDEVLAHHLKLVKDVLTDIGAEYDPATGMFVWNRQEYTPDSMATRSYAALAKKGALTSNAAKCAMEAFVAEERQRRIEAARGRVLAHDPSVGDEHVRR